MKESWEDAYLTNLATQPLENVLERMLIMSGERVTVMNLPEELLAPEVDAPNTSSALRDFRDKTEREYIIGVLRKHKGNVSQAAVELGIEDCFQAFLPKPDAYVDDQEASEWRYCKHVLPGNAGGA